MTRTGRSPSESPFRTLEAIDLFLSRLAQDANATEGSLAAYAYGRALTACDAMFSELLTAIDAVDELSWNAPSRMLGRLPAPSRWHCGKTAQCLRAEWNGYFADGTARLLQAETSIDLGRELQYCIDFGERLCRLRIRQKTQPWLRLGVLFRHLVGIAGLRKRNFRMAYEIVQDTVEDFESWKWECRAQTWIDGIGAEVPGPWLDGKALQASRRSGIFYTELQRIFSEPGLERLILSFALSEALLGAHLEQWRARDLHPLISIILPSYNRAFILSQAIESVCEQTWPHWELWVCDDGSADNTRQIVESFDDERIHYLALAHGGAAKARNAGLNKAHGSVIAYLDSDNLWHPAFLEVMLNIVARSETSGLAYGNFLDVRIQGDHIIDVYEPFPRPFSYERLTRGNYIDLNFFAHATAFTRLLGGFAPELRKRQDWDLALKYAFRRHIRPVALSLGIYRRNESWDQITERRHLTAEANKVIYAHLDDYYRSGVITTVEKEPRLGLMVAPDDAPAQADADAAARAWQNFAAQPAQWLQPDDGTSGVDVVFRVSDRFLHVPTPATSENQSASDPATLPIPVRPPERDEQAREALRRRLGFTAEDSVVLVPVNAQSPADSCELAEWLRSQGCKALMLSEEGCYDADGQRIPGTSDVQDAELARACDAALLHFQRDVEAVPAIVSWLCAHAVPMAGTPHPLLMPLYRERAILLYEAADSHGPTAVLVALLHKPVGKACADAAYRYYLRHFSERAWYENVLLAHACALNPLE